MVGLDGLCFSCLDHVISFALMEDEGADSNGHLSRSYIAANRGRGNQGNSPKATIQCRT